MAAWEDVSNTGQVFTSCSRFHSRWRVIQNKKSKQWGMIIYGSLKNRKSVYYTVGNVLTTMIGNVLTKRMGKVFDIDNESSAGL